MGRVKIATQISCVTLYHPEAQEAGQVLLLFPSSILPCWAPLLLPARSEHTTRRLIPLEIETVLNSTYCYKIFDAKI